MKANYKADYAKWIAEKAQRGREHKPKHGFKRHHTYDGLRSRKFSLLISLYASREDYTCRTMLFNQLAEARLHHSLVNCFSDDRSSSNYDLKLWMRKHIEIARVTRLENGVPMVFVREDRPFWCDPNSLYLPDDDYFVAQHYVPFYVFKATGNTADYHNVRNVEFSRKHKGYWHASWSGWPGDGDDDNHGHFCFTDLTDMIQFRLDCGALTEVETFQQQVRPLTNS